MTASEERARRWRGFVPWALLTAVALGSLAAANYVAESARQRDQLRFEAAAQQAHEAIRDRVEGYIALLRATSGLFAAVSEVDRDLFHAYVERLELKRRYPGLVGIGFSKRLRPDEMTELSARMRAQGFPGFRHWPEHSGPEKHAILYLEPLDDENGATLGFDMSADPVRRAAMERARDTGLGEGSGKVALTQKLEPKPQAGFLVYVPVYAGGGVPETLAERRAALQGFAYGPFSADDLMWGIFGGETPRNIQVEVYDGGQVREDALMQRSGGVAPESSAPDPNRVPIALREFSSHTTFDMAGRVWTLQFRSGPHFPRDAAWRVVPVVLVGGLVTAVLLFVITRGQVRAREQAEAMATDNAMLYRQAESARAEAEVANRAKDEFLATLSHELRTPLTAILGWTRILRKEEVDEPTQVRGLEVIERNVRAQTRLIEDVLDVSRIITGKMQLNVRRVEMPGVIDAAIESVRPAAEARKIEVVPIVEGAATIMGDGERLQQVVWNLLSNAIKFTPNGGRIEVRLRTRGEAVDLEVADSGKGIAAEFLPYVFDRFRQADSSSTRSHGGLGIGLALVRHLVELHGGSVQARSGGEGRGSTFSISLPVAGPAAETGDIAPVPAATVIRASLSGLPTLEGLRVLVVDDEADARDLIGVILRRRGATVEAAASVAEALEAVERARPDVVVSDISMPESDGYQLVRELRRREATAGAALPAVALTAYARTQDHARSIAAGFQVHLAKPVEPDDLILAVANLAGRTASGHPEDKPPGHGDTENGRGASSGIEGSSAELTAAGKREEG
jgi:signal transduction histidine kinase/ActR/RegA family two-component response regulator